MSGTQGNIKEIVALKQKYNFRLLIDDAHGFGSMGPTGAGADEAQGCQDRGRSLFQHVCKKHGKYWRIYCRAKTCD